MFSRLKRQCCFRLESPEKSENLRCIPTPSALAHSPLYLKRRRLTRQKKAIFHRVFSRKKQLLKKLVQKVIFIRIKRKYTVYILLYIQHMQRLNEVLPCNEKSYKKKRFSIVQLEIHTNYSTQKNTPENNNCMPSSAGPSIFLCAPLISRFFVAHIIFLRRKKKNIHTYF